MAKKKKKRSAGKYFDTMANAAAMTGIPLAEIKRAKKSNCAAFRGSRVYERDLRAWLAANPRDPEALDWKNEKVKVQTQREKIKLKKEEKRAVDFESVKFALASGMSKMFAMMDRIFTVELPPSLKGLDELGIQKKCMESNETFKAELRASLLAMSQETRTAEPTS